MELLSLVFVLVIPAVLTAWGLSFKKLFSLLAVPPMLIIVFIVLILNSDPTLEYTHIGTICPAVALNSTATVEGNVTTTIFNSDDCRSISTNVSESIPAQLMTMLNFTVIVGMLSVAFVVLRRITKLVNRGQDEE